MTELEKALQNAAQNGYEVCTEYMQQAIPMIGFRLKNKHVYYWFRVTADAHWLLFDHAYSQNTGKSKRDKLTWARAQYLFLPI